MAPASRGLILGAALLFAQTMAAGASDGRTLSAPSDPSIPGLVLDTLAGPRYALEDGRGRVRLVHFFATWCEPCRPELASLEALRADRADDGLDVLAISVAEPEARLRRYFADNPTGLTILLDRDRAAAKAWRIEALPSTVVVDRDGRARLAVRGDLDWGRADVRSALDTLLSGPDGKPKTKETRGTIR